MIKICSRCGGERTLYSDKKYRCKKCVAIRNRKNQEKNKEAYAAVRKAYYQKNRESILQQAVSYRDKNKEKIKDWMASYREDNRDKLKQDKAIYYHKNKEIIADYKKAKYSLQHPLLAIWQGMLQRCYNPNRKSYKYYGGRGIGVCEKWRNSFELFLEDVGPTYRKGLTLDRYPDPNGDYGPENFRWATVTEQNNNRRFNIAYRNTVPDCSPIYYPYGNLITLREFSEITGLPLIVAKYRYALNWEADSILSKEERGRVHFYNGYTYTTKELSLISGVDFSIISDRIQKLKWSVEDAVTTKRDSRKISDRGE